jgi:hypothetical protein
LDESIVSLLVDQKGNAMTFDAYVNEEVLVVSCGWKGKLVSQPNGSSRGVHGRQMPSCLMQAFWGAFR